MEFLYWKKRKRKEKTKCVKEFSKSNKEEKEHYTYGGVLKIAYNVRVLPYSIKSTDCISSK